MAADYEAHFQDHLAQVQRHFAGDHGKQLPPSFVPPSTYWSSTEKNAFFHALSVHSRLRPDLIAASVGTKTVLDVCTYLDILDVAASNADSPIARQSLPHAMEVSEAWTKWEEESAVRIDTECSWNDEGITITGASCLVATVECEKSDPAHQASRENEINPSQQQQALRMLDACHLAVMESILREAETTSTGLEQELLVAPKTYHPRDNLNGDMKRVTVPNNIPVAYSLDGDEPSSSKTPRSPTPTPPYPQEDNLNLTPMSRRRLQKRIYMRRKRAEATGEDFDPEAVRLRPGRKTRERGTIIPRISDASGHASRSLNDEQALEHAAHSKGGLRRPYKTKKHFMECGIDAQTLNKYDLGFFHLSTLARLMKLFRSGYDSPEAEEVVGISDDTIRLLTSIAIEFTTNLIHLSVTSREQEKSVKGNLKVWRQNHEEVTPEHVKQGLTMMGATFLNKENYFKNLLGSETSFSTEERESPTTDDIPEGSDKSFNHNSEYEFSLCPMTLATAIHHETHPPQVMLPVSVSMKISFQDEGSTDIVVPFELEDSDLQLELDAEMEIDKIDMDISKAYEVRLWNSTSPDIILE